MPVEQKAWEGKRVTRRSLRIEVARECKLHIESGRALRIGGGKTVGLEVGIEAMCSAPWDRMRALAVAVEVEHYQNMSEGCSLRTKKIVEGPGNWIERVGGVDAVVEVDR